MPRSAAPLATASLWPPLSENNQWVMVEAETLLDHPGGSAEVLEICRRARASGYDGLMLWDSNLWERDLPPGYLENAKALKRGLRELGFTLVVQVCPRGYVNVRWSRDETMCEPRPDDPHPREKDYRYLCLAHPGVHAVWEAQLRRAEEIYRPMGWHLQGYNEIRVAGTDELCERSGRNPGQLLRDHVRRTLEMVREVTPDRVVSVWNDMFDPNHVAQARKYYHVVGHWAAAAGAVDKDVLVLTWNNVKRSFQYWADRGNKQIVPIYYDHDDITLEAEQDLVKAARRLRKSTIGWMFSTWKRNYAEVETYGEIYGDGSPARLLAPPVVSARDRSVPRTDRRDQTRRLRPGRREHRPRTTRLSR